MRLRVHVVHHLAPETMEFLSEFLTSMENIVSDFQDTLDKLKAQVAAEGDVVNSATVLLQNYNSALATALQNAANNGVPEGALQELNDIVSASQAQTASLAQAVAANTPAASTATGGDVHDQPKTDADNSGNNNVSGLGDQSGNAAE